MKYNILILLCVCMIYAHSQIRVTITKASLYDLSNPHSKESQYEKKTIRINDSVTIDTEIYKFFAPYYGPSVKIEGTIENTSKDSIQIYTSKWFLSYMYENKEYSNYELYILFAGIPRNNNINSIIMNPHSLLKFTTYARYLYGELYQQQKRELTEKDIFETILTYKLYYRPNEHDEYKSDTTSLIKELSVSYR